MFILISSRFFHFFALKGTATGQLYFDDAVTFNYRKNKEFVHREFEFSSDKLVSRNLEPSSKFTTRAWLERVIIYGYTKQPKSVKIEYKNQSAQLQFTYDANNKDLLIRKPAINMDIDWTIVLS